jgi:L-asparaginase II
MVSGPGTFTTRLMEVTGGRVLGKEGAEGIYATAVRGPVALGMVLKIADGNSRGWPGAVLDLLRQLGSLSEEELTALEVFHRGVIRNRRGIEVGRVVPDVELKEVNDSDPGTPA